MTLDEVRDFIDRHAVRTVICAGTDPAGVLRGKRLTVPHFLRVAEHGVGFASVVLMTSTLDEVLPGLLESGIPDVEGRPDLATFRLAPWEPHTAVVLLDWHEADGRPSDRCPRSLLRRQVTRVRELGLAERFALELEFFVFPQPVAAIRAGAWGPPEPPSQDLHCYSVYEGHFQEPLMARLRECFPDAIESCTPEFGPGQHEVNLAHAGALAMADTAVLFKTAVKQLAAQSGQSATFMAKVRDDASGSSGHVHQSFATPDGASACHDPAATDRLSPFFRAYVAGQLDALRETTLFLAPFVNSYKRLRDGGFAGTTRTWGLDNRTCGLRVINTSPQSCRVEHRVGGADLNPYTAFAALLGAGLRGVEMRLELPPPTEGDACAGAHERVPASLAEAVLVSDRSPLTRELLPAAFVDNLLRIARFELGVFDATVTDLERRRYYERV